MNELVLKTLQLIHSSKRTMPAHFCHSGDRTQTFHIDFDDLTKEDDYAMASESWGSLGYESYGNPNIEGFTEEDKKNQGDIELICGENIMVGSFILTKLGGEKLLDELKRQILEDALDDFSSIRNIEKILKTERSNAYFEHCKDFGYQRAKLLNN